jgi:hypothetical protein
MEVVAMTDAHRRLLTTPVQWLVAEVVQHVENGPVRSNTLGSITKVKDPERGGIYFSAHFTYAGADWSLGEFKTLKAARAAIDRHFKEVTE